MGDFLQIHTILGPAGEEPLAGPLHALSHQGAVETICLSREDMHRRRLRVTTDQGTECAIVLPRSQQLVDGAVLWLDRRRAVVVRMHETSRLVFQPEDSSAALELGYLAGNMHWQVNLDGGVMQIVVNSNKEAILKRMAPLLDSGKVRQIQHE